MNNENQIKAGLWKTISKSGNEYFNGKVEIDGKTYRIAMFPNNNKLSEKSPDYNLSFTELEEVSVQPTQTSSENNDWGKQSTINAGSIDLDDELPF